MNNVIIFDTEYTTWENAKDCDWSEQWMEKEIVQIAAVKVNIDNMEILAEFASLVKPVINPLLSDCFIQLTGIDNTNVKNNGVSFKDAYKSFCDFAEDLECFVH